MNNRCGIAASFLILLLPLLRSADSTAAEQDPSERLEKLFEDSWEADVRFDPLWASRVGEHRFDALLPQVSLAAHAEQRQMKEAFLRRWQSIEREQLAPQERLNYDIFGRLLRDDLAEYEFAAELMPITNRSGFHISFPELPKNTLFRSVEDYRNYIHRLAAFKRYADEHIELMRAGIKRGVVLPAVVLEGYAASIEPHIVQDPAQSLLYAPFTDKADQLSAEVREELAAAARQAIQTSVVPGYQAFLDFMQEEYVPAARGSIGLAALENGRAFYRQRVRRFTTLDLAPEEVHQLGLSEVRRIRREMQQVIERAEFDGSLAEFIEYLRTDPQFYAETPAELLKEVAFVLKKMDGRLPELFGKLPRMSYGVREVPAYIAPRTTTAYYQLPAGDGTRAGFYYVNTYDLKSRPLFEIEALSLHEAVPGHHLQLALQQELTGVPRFRRHAGFTAFIEGWALYAERLGLEVGFYQDPYRNFGRLSYEMWRACRLVVDTGVHYLGWTRQQAIDYMAENTALSRHNIVSEVDRYIAWPGQALAYKMGELKIRELRKLARSELGEQFDLRQFHDVVLSNGSVPLDVLEQQVRAYVAQTQMSQP